MKKLTEIGLVSTKLVQKNNRTRLLCRLNKDAFGIIEKFVETVQLQVEQGNYEYDNFYIAYRLQAGWQSTS